MIKVELETGTVIHTEVGVQGLPGPAGIGVPDPTAEVDGRLLTTSGGTLVYTDAPPVSGQLSDLTDVDTTGAVNDYVLTFDSGLWVPKVIPSSTGTFTALTDTPGSFLGQGGQFVRVNLDATALEFVDPPAGGGAETFTALTDTPGAYTGEGQKIVRVNAGETGLEFVEAAAGGATALGDLTDVDTYGVADGDVLAYQTDTWVSLSLGDAALLDAMHENHSGVTVAEVGNQLRLTVDAETLDLGEAATLDVGTEEGTVASGNDPRFGQGALPLVAGGAGFHNVGGAVTLDLASAWTHHITVTAEVTGLSFLNIPNPAEISALVRLVIQQDAVGSHSIAEPADLVFRDGRVWADLVDGPNAMNVLWLERVGSVWHTYLDNGSLELDDFYLDLTDGPEVRVVIRRPVLIDVTDAEVDGVGGAPTYKKNGDAITTPTAFGRGEVFTVTGTTGQLVTIPRYL